MALVTAGLGCAAALSRRAGLSTRVRDLLHVGAGSWVFGWSAWQRPWVAIAIPWMAAAVLASLPRLAVTSRGARAVISGVTGEEERWSGVVLYAVAFALLTTAALGGRADLDAAAVALLALAWGDGLGGAVGSWLGSRTYRLPWTKPRSWVGSAMVAAATMVGVLAWSAWTGRAAGPLEVAGAGAVAALAEAVAPRGTDNLTVPAAVFAWMLAVG